MSWWTPQRIQYAIGYLISAGGLSPYGAAGLVSRWANVESRDSGPTAVNRTSGAFGIAQWLGARKRGIYPNTDFDSQLAYVVQELSGPESRAAAALRRAADPQAAAVGASMYERAEGYNAATGRDNFTATTAAGVGQALAYYQSGGAPVTTSALPGQTMSAGAGAGLGLGAVLLIGGLLLGAYWLSD